MKTQKRVQKLKQTKAVPAPPLQNPKPAALAAVAPLEGGNPDPEFLLNEAMNEPNRRLLEEYAGVIRVLRNEKRFTFREIAEWLNLYGVETDHNAVYRQYTKGMPPGMEAMVEEEAMREENDES